MANKSGVSEQIISLPKGGGALKGIEEKFQPDLHTGTGNYNIPIDIPEGRNGFQPQLTLDYSTGNGNGHFGLGWQLSIPNITRKTSKGIPRYRDNSGNVEEKDTFVMSSAEDLVLVKEEANMGSANDETHSYYRPRTEGIFASIKHVTGSGKNHWEVTSKSGIRSTYGIDNSCRIFDNKASDHIFSWLLCKIEDTFGNLILYYFKHDDGKKENGTTLASDGHWYEENHEYNQKYITKIQYVDYRPDGTINDAFLYSIEFDYGEFDQDGTEINEWEYRQDDPFSFYKAEFEIRTVRRCKRILIKVHEEGKQPGLVKSYDFAYKQAEYNRTSFLHSVTLKGYRDKEAGDNPGDVLEDGTIITENYRLQSFPTLEFGYTEFEPKNKKYQNITANCDLLPEKGLTDTDYELIDLNGYGLPGIIQTSRTGYRYWRNLGNGKLDLPHPMHAFPADVTLADSGVQFADMEGNGKSDLLVSSGPLTGYYRTTFNEKWDPASFHAYNQSPSFNLEDSDVRLVDMDGDGMIDVLHTNLPHFEIYYNRGEKGWDPDIQHITRGSSEDFPDVNFGDPEGRVKFADMSGDGIQDIVLIHDGRIDFWPHMGYGKFGKRITLRNAPRFGHGFDAKRIILSDIDGDGYCDLIYVDFDKTIICINQNGNSWSDPIVIHGTPQISDIDSVRAVDFMGNGTAGILWSYDYANFPGSNYKFLDLTGGIKPYLLNEMVNNVGAITKVKYRPSTWFFLQDQEKEFDWKTHLPFPVQCVSRVEVIDEISKGKLSTEYQYHHGYWDGEEREFRGFGRTDQRDTEVFEHYNSNGLHEKQNFTPIDAMMFSPPTETRTWFHLGPIHDDFGSGREADYIDEYWNGDPSMLERSEETNNFLRALPLSAKRDAIRTLSGSILRTELYALDNSNLEERPYTVSESQYGLREEFQLSDGEANRLNIFFPHLLAQRTTQWERGNDPMTQFSFIEDYDEFGLSRKQTQIACPRGWRRPEDIPGEAYLVTRTNTVYAHRNTTDVYIVDRIARNTTFEILNDGSQSVFALRDIPDESSLLHIIGQIINFYDGNEFVGLPFGDIGDYGALVRTESLILTEEILRKAYHFEGSVEIPPYLQPSGSPPWTDNYPNEFHSLLADLAGYTFQTAGLGSPYESGYYAATERRRYDFQDIAVNMNRGLVTAIRDLLGNNTIPRDTTVQYDNYALLPTTVTDPAGLSTAAIYDYRVLQTRLVTGPNGNRSLFTFKPLGLLESTAVMGKEEFTTGDNPENPSTWLIYDFHSFLERQKPISVQTIQREHHENDTDVPLPERNHNIVTIEYSDGFGRILQTRAQAEDVLYGDDIFGESVLPANQSDPLPGNIEGRVRQQTEPINVRVNGWQVYNNKGWVVEKYESFFSDGYDYRSAGEEFTMFGREVLGKKATLFYDALGRTIKTINPNDSVQQVIFGVPGSIAAPDISTPEEFETTPWEIYTYDANDNGGLTHPTESLAYLDHWNTPASVKVDPLGRTIQAIERNGRDPADWYTTRSEYDIQGNLLKVIDALDRQAFLYQYDLDNNVLRMESIDSGVQRTILDAAGNEIERCDSKGALILQAYDFLDRPIRMWARDVNNESVTLREMLIYGDGINSGLIHNEALTENLLGKLYQLYDEAGLLTFSRYDFKGNLLEKSRRVISDEQLLTAFTSTTSNGRHKPFRVNWQPPSGETLAVHVENLLETKVYQTSYTFDALNRIKYMQYPLDDDNERKKLLPNYNRAGDLKHLELDSTTYVEHVAYNAKGQRTLIAYGNGVMTNYAYDSQSSRLKRLRSERYSRSEENEHTFLRIRPGQPLQDNGYEYDLVGNILSILNRTPNSGIPDTTLGINALNGQFGYDPLYRLISATGRECDTPTPNPPWDDTFRCNDVTQTRAYTQEYTYDPMGNMTRLRHIAGAHGSFTRLYTPHSGTNRLQSMEVGTNPFSYETDVNGNMIRENNNRHFEWDHSDQLKAFAIQSGSSTPSVQAHYIYDFDGKRIKKLVRKQNGDYNSTVYIDGIYEHDYWKSNSTESENTHLHIMDDQQRIAVARIGEPFPDDTAPGITVKFHLGNHIGSSTVVIDETGGWITREEYTPYGESSFGSFALKRYRYAGKEKDEESGFYYYGARYYACWLGRWISPDPLKLSDNINLFRFVNNNPVVLFDPDGKEDWRAKLSWGQRFALWVDDTVGTENLQHAANFSAGFGDTMSFGTTRLVRQAQGTDSVVQHDSAMYRGGG